jgi:Outer membrane lipoprotein carrier protein LolA-like
MTGRGKRAAGVCIERMKVFGRVAVWLCVSAAGAPCAMAQPEAAAWGLPQLMQELGQVHAATGRFVERKTLHVLTEPLTMSGTLAYAAPDYLRKTTLSPVREDFVLDHDQVEISSGPEQQRQDFSLGEAPQIAGLVEGVRATLAGDLPMLEKFYTVRLTGSEAGWQLFLQPKTAQGTRFIKWMLIQGRANRLTAIDTASLNGDHSEMSVVEDTSDAD